MDLMQKLSETKVDTTLFRSTKTMGAAKESKREQMRRALLEEKFGINVEENAMILYEERRVRDPRELGPVELYKSAEGMTLNGREKVKKDGRDNPPTSGLPGVKNITTGSGLKRPLEPDANGQPIIKKIKKSRNAQKERLIAKIKAMEQGKEQEEGGLSLGEDEGEEDEGIDSKSDVQDTAEEEWGGIADSHVGGDFQHRAKLGGTVVDINGWELPGESDLDVSGSGEEGEGDGDVDKDGDERKETVPRLKRGRSEKANAFKEWALAQRKEVMNEGDPSGADTSMSNLLAPKPKVAHAHVLRKREEDITPPPELQVPTVERKVSLNQPTAEISLQVAKMDS